MDKRISKANDLDPSRPGGWIVDLSPASGPQNPDQYFAFSTRKQAQEFCRLIDSGMRPDEAAYNVTR